MHGGLDNVNLGVNMQLLAIRRGPWQVLAVCSGRGDCPLMDFLGTLEGRLAGDGRRLLRVLSEVAEHGPPRDAMVSHQVGAGVWQLIAGQIRVFWMYDLGRVVILSHGFVKRSRKTPQRELDLARANWARYRRAREHRSIEVLEVPQ